MQVKLKAQLSGTDHEVSLNVAGTVAVVEIDGRTYEVETRALAGGEYLLKNGLHVYKCRVERKRDSARAGGTFEVVVRGRSYDVSIVDPKRLPSGQTGGAHHAGAAEIVSQMPGKIVRVLVAQGAAIEAGAGVVVVEAMKMQNEMKAPKTGVVVSINTQAGATVNAGDVLAVIE